MLGQSRLPRTVHDEWRYRLWRRRFYPLNVYSEKRRLEKLTYLHNNPVKRRLVGTPGEWPWSSWRFYFLNRVRTGLRSSGWTGWVDQSLREIADLQIRGLCHPAVSRQRVPSILTATIPRTISFRMVRRFWWDYTQSSTWDRGCTARFTHL
jgi:hypothetical protein